METTKSSIKPNGKRKVYYKFARRSHKWIRHPVIRLGGIYLKEYGFNPGDEIEVSFAQGRIVIKKLRQ